MSTMYPHAPLLASVVSIVYSDQLNMLVSSSGRQGRTNISDYSANHTPTDCSIERKNVVHSKYILCGVRLLNICCGTPVVLNYSANNLFPPQ